MSIALMYFQYLKYDDSSGQGVPWEGKEKFRKLNQKWNLEKSGCDDGIKIELRMVLAQFGANLSFPAPGMLLSGL